MKEFLTSSFSLGTISIETSQPLVAVSVPKICFPISPAILPPASSGKGQNILSKPNPTAAKTPAAGKTTSLSQMKAKKLTSYDVKLHNDEKDCWVTGMAITKDGRQLLIDLNNKKVKMFSREMTI